MKINPLSLLTPTKFRFPSFAKRNARQAAQPDFLRPANTTKPKQPHLKSQIYQEAAANLVHVPRFLRDSPARPVSTGLADLDLRGLQREIKKQEKLKFDIRIKAIQGEIEPSVSAKMLKELDGRIEKALQYKDGFEKGKEELHAEQFAKKLNEAVSKKGALKLLDKELSITRENGIKERLSNLTSGSGLSPKATRLMERELFLMKQKLDISRDPELNANSDEVERMKGYAGLMSDVLESLVRTSDNDEIKNLVGLYSTISDELNRTPVFSSR